MLTIIFLALLAIGQLAIGALLFMEGKRTKRLDQKLFAYLSFTFVLWTLAVGRLSDVDAVADTTNIGSYQLANKAAFILTCLVLVLFYLFSLQYPFKRSIGAVEKIFIYVGGILALLSVLPFFSGQLSVFHGGLVYDYGKGVAAVVLFALMVLGSVYKAEYGRSRKTHDSKLRQQTNTLLLGMTLTIAHTIIFVVLFPSIFGQSPIFYAIGYAGPYYLVLFTAYGLLQQGLFDIRLIVARSLGYITTILTLSALYGFLIFGISSVVFDLNISIAAQIFLSLATGVASLSFQKFKAFFDRATNSIFYRDAYDPQVLFDELNKTLVSTIDLDKLLVNTSQIIASYLKADYCVIGLTGIEQASQTLRAGDKQFVRKELLEATQLAIRLHQSVIVADRLTDAHTASKAKLDRDNVGLIARLVTDYKKEEDGLGVIMLGAKKSGNPYTGQDILVIEAISNELVIALQNALRFEEIERFNETLQQRVENATRHLSQANLKLKKLNDTKDDFIGMASHQLRTPLTSAKGYISLVLDGDAGRINASQRRLLEQAFTSSQRMVYLIADLLNVSRLKTGKFLIERTATNLPKLIEGELAQLRTAASAHDIELTFDPPANFPTLMLDETKTRQVVMNFLDNAIYYTPNGGHINAALRELPESIEFRVTDDGIGVPDDEHHSLFTKFYRAKNAQRARPDGTGLGLYMAQKVIVGQGGSTIFNSKEGQGSVFGFSFPKNSPGLIVKDIDKDTDVKGKAATS